MHYKVRVDGKIEHKALYNILGINKEGYKEKLGMYISESEGANFWLQVLTDLQNPGLGGDILNSLKYIASEDQKKFIKDLKKVYRAVNKEVAKD